MTFFEAAPQSGEPGSSSDPACVVWNPSGADLDRMAASRSGDAGAYFRRLAAGHHLLMARDEARHPAAWGWLTLPGSCCVPVPWERTATLAVPVGEGYLWDFFTAPEARGHGLYRRLLRDALSFCGRLDCGSVRIYCYPENSASRRGIQATGFRETASLVLARFGPTYAAVGPSVIRIVSGGAPVPLGDLLRPSRVT
jgi:GNAT superfamily N-acetyltransferase